MTDPAPLWSWFMDKLRLIHIEDPVDAGGRHVSSVLARLTAAPERVRDAASGG